MVQVKVCALDLVPIESMKQFYVKDREVLVVHSNNQVYCLDARCTHAGAPLEEGTIDKGVLTCPWHGSQFKVVDGSIQKGPAERPLRTYQVTLRENIVFIEV